MKKIRLNENDIERLVKRIIKEERLGQTTRFYHKTCKKHLPSLMKGVRSDFNLDRDIGGGGFTIDIFQAGEASKSQGGGFYVSQDAEYIRDLDLPMSDCELDTIIEIVAPLTTENFEIDYELFPNFCDVLIKLIDISGLNLYKFTPSKNGPIAVRVNKVNDVGHRSIVVMSKDDINEKTLEVIGDWETVRSNNKEVGFFTLGGCKDKKPNMSGLHKQLESMNMFGIKDKLEETVFNNLPKKSALKYKGPTTKVTNYWININGKWVKNPKPRKK